MTEETKQTKHYFFDLQEENEEAYNYILGFLNKVLTEEAKENWLDDRFPMTVDEWFFATEQLSFMVRVPFIQPEKEEGF